MSNDINPSVSRVDHPKSTLSVAGIAKPRTETTQYIPVQVKADIPDPGEMRRQVQEVTEQLNRQMANEKRDLNFSVDDQSDRVVITVKNASGEVVRQIPDVSALRVAHNLSDIKGLMEDKKI